MKTELLCGGFKAQRGDELTLHLLSLLFLTRLGNLYWTLVPGNQSSKQEKIQLEKEADWVLRAAWTVVA